MPFIAGGFSQLRDRQKADSMNKSEEKTDCGTAISEFETEVEKELDHVGDISDFQTKLIKDEALKTNFHSVSNSQNRRCELQSDEKAEILCCDIDHVKEFIWTITNFLHLPKEEGYYIDSEKFSIANASWCLRIYPNGKNGCSNGCSNGCICLHLVRLQSYNSVHRIHYRFGLKTRRGINQGSFIHAVTYHADKEMGFVNLIERLDVLKHKKNLVNEGIFIAFCEIFMVEEVTVPLLNPTSGTESLETSIKTEELCLQSSLSEPEIYIWKINNFLELPVNDGFFIESAEFSIGNATWCIRMYPNGQRGRSKEWIHLFLVRVFSSNSEHQVQFSLGFKKLNNRELGTLIHGVTFLTNGVEMGVINLLKRSDIIHQRKLFLENGILTVFCHIHVMKEYGYVISNNILSQSQCEPSSKFQLMQTKENLMQLYPKTVLSSQDTFTWEITNFLKLPMNEGYFIDSTEFSFANTTWCLRMYPNGKKGNHSGWVHLLLVQLQPSKSRHQIYYRLGLKIQDKDLHKSLTHMIILNGNVSEIGIVDTLKRSDICSMKKFAQNSFLVAFCEIEEVELSSCADTLESSSKYQTKELAKPSQKLCLSSVISCKDIFIWNISNFFELPRNEGHFIDSEEFSIANSIWCLRIYPDGQKGKNSGWIHLFLIRLRSCSSQQCIQYRLGFKKKKNKECGTLTHFVAFPPNSEEMGVVNIIKRSYFPMKKKSAEHIFTVFCQVSIANNTGIEVTNETVQLEPLSENCLVTKLENSSVGVLEEWPFLGAKDVIWKIPSFVIEPMQVGQWMDSPVFSFLNENWCLRFYMKQKKIGKDWKIYMYLVRFNNCSFMYLITYELSILDKYGNWLKFKKHNCQGIYQSHVMKLGVSKLHFPPDGFVGVYFQILSKEEVAEASMVTDKPKYHLEFPLNDVELHGPSLFRHGFLFEKTFLAATEFTWKIPDFFELGKAVDDNINSPVFEFGSDTWLLQLYPNGFEKNLEKISFVLTRLYFSLFEQHIICHFSIRNSVKTISRCKLEEVFKGSSKSSPVHLELPEIVNKLKENVSNGILTVFCQMYIMKENENSEHLEPVTKDPLNITNQFRYGLLFQQSCSAVTDITWKIPNLLALENEDCYFINSPVFTIANESWLLQLYPKGYETSTEKISLVLVRLCPSDVNHHVICKFSSKNIYNMVGDKVNCENTFKGKIVKSSPIHLKKFKSIKEQRDDSTDILTVFCQMHITEDNKAAHKTSSETTQPKKMEVFSLNDMKQYIYGELVQQLFLAATEVMWKIPDFLKLSKKNYYFINSSVFGLANDTWLLRLFTNGSGKTSGKISCALVRLFPSSLERHVICKISIQNKNNVIIESGSCEIIFNRKSRTSCPVHLEQSKVMSNVRENVPQNVLILVCQIYIIDDNRDTLVETSSKINQPESVKNEDPCMGDMVALKEKENKAHFYEGFENNTEDLVSKGVEQILEGKDINKDLDELDFSLLKKKKKKSIMFDLLEAEHPLSEKKNEADLARNEDPCRGDMVVIKENENKAYFCEGFQNNAEDLKGERNILEDEKDINKDLDELDFTLVMKKKKKNIITNQLEGEHISLEKKKEGNLVRTGTDAGVGVVCNFQQDKSCKSLYEESNTNCEEKSIKHDENNDIDGKVNATANDLNVPNEKIMNSDQLHEYLEKKKHIEKLEKVTDPVLHSVTDKDKENSFKELQHNIQKTDFKDVGNSSNERVFDELNLMPLEKNAVKNDPSDCSIDDAKDVDKIHQDSGKAPVCEKDYDLRFLVRGEEIRCHLSDFKEQASYFTSVIQHDIMKGSGMVVIDDSDPQVFKVFLLYLYTGRVDVLTSENVFGLYSMANRYGIHKLKIECLQYMKNTISVDTVCDIMAFSFQQKEKEILDLTTAFFSKNATEITSTTKWQMFLEENYTFANQLLETVLKN